MILIEINDIIYRIYITPIFKIILNYLKDSLRESEAILKSEIVVKLF